MSQHQHLFAFTLRPPSSSPPPPPTPHTHFVSPPLPPPPPLQALLQRQGSVHLLSSVDDPCWVVPLRPDAAASAPPPLLPSALFRMNSERMQWVEQKKALQVGWPSGLVGSRG